ncbi:hypothetical protein ACWC9T_09260 [Kitasatospora sp. NPDC001159]
MPFKRITSGRARVERGLIEHTPGASKGVLQLVVSGLGQDGGAQCAGGESLFENGRPAGFEAVADALVDEEVTQRVPVTHFTRSAGQLLDQVSGGGRVEAGGVEVLLLGWVGVRDEPSLGALVRSAS